MKLLKNSKNISVSVENVTSFGAWLYVKGNEYFLDCQVYPFFQHKAIEDIKNVCLFHSPYLYRSSLDSDLEIDNLENPGKYPLTCRA